MRGAHAKQHVTLVNPRVPENVKCKDRPVCRPDGHADIEPATAGKLLAGQAQSLLRRGRQTPRRRVRRLPCRVGQPLAGGDSRVEACGGIDDTVPGLSGDQGSHVAQVADDVVRGPFGAPGWGGPVVWTEFPEHLDEPPPLPAEYLEQMICVEVA